MTMNINKKNQSRPLFDASLPYLLNLTIAAVFWPAFCHANPDGAQIVSGQVSIDSATPGVTSVTNSPNAIINWQNFSIAQNELVQFLQQNGQSAVLNRIIGQNPSEILGQLFSNGKVFLINPNGIVFGAGSSIDTQGLIASSLNLSDQDFLSGNYHFMAGSSSGNIVNEGIIRAGKDGNIILIAPQIENNGIIKSDGGSITLAAGQELTMTNLDDPDIRFQIQAPTDSVVNLGKLLSEGGAVNVFANSIIHSGEINADSVEMDAQGNIKLVAQQDITYGAQTANGQVSTDAATPGVITVNNSPNTIINWQNFSIAQNELTRFIQQDHQSAALNRIIDQNVTLISIKENILRTTAAYPIMNVAAGKMPSFAGSMESATYPITNVTAVVVGTMHQQWQPFADEWNSNRDFMAEKGN